MERCRMTSIPFRRLHPNSAQNSQKRVADWETTYPELAKVATHLKTCLSRVGLEDLWTCVDYHAKFPGAFIIDWDPRGPVVAELKSALLRLYGRTCDAAANQLILSTSYTLGEIVEEMKPGDTFVSLTTTHTLAERLFQKRQPSVAFFQHSSGSFETACALSSRTARPLGT